LVTLAALVASMPSLLNDVPTAPVAVLVSVKVPVSVMPGVAVLLSTAELVQDDAGLVPRLQARRTLIPA